MSRSKKRKKRPGRFRRLLGAALLCAAVLLFAGRVLPGLGAAAQSLFALPQSQPVGSGDLLLVNRSHPLPRGYTVELTPLSHGQRVASRILPDLQAMFNQARAEGLALFVREGYRTARQQQQLLEEKQAAYRAEGLSRKRARQAAEAYVAPVDASEHQLGLAVDINADTARSSREQVYAWLAAHAHEYGFILRYPADKTEHTGFAYEPWHYRYVGRQAAAEIHAQGLCLEEYLAQQ